MPSSVRPPILVVLLAISPSAMAEHPEQAPALPPPDPEVFGIVEVETAQELADACWNLQSDQAILVAPGTYDLSSVDFPNGTDGRLTVGRYGAPPISNVQIRGASGDPTDVLIHGAGMLDSVVPFGFQIFTATDVLIADLSISGVYYHAVAIQNDQGATRVHLYHLRLYDAGQQIVKANRGTNPGAADVIIEYSELFYTDGAVAHPEGSPPNSCYTNGIDAIGGQRWIIRHNLLRDIRCANGALAGPAVLMWQGSADTLVDSNTFLRSSRGVSLGLMSSDDHDGGLIRNNFFRWDPAATYQVDVPIYVSSPGAEVLHNTVLTRGTYGNGVEIRFGGTTDVDVRHNLLDSAITERDGASATVSANELGARPEWFVDEAAGNLKLRAIATDAVDRVTRLPLAELDFDGRQRPADAARTDLGAWELLPSIFDDGFESGSTSAWDRVLP